MAYSTNKSSKSKASGNNSKSTKFLSLFFKTMGNLDVSARTEMEQKYMKKQLSIIDILKKIIDNQKCLAFRVFFNLNFSMIKTKSQELIYVSLSISKMIKYDDDLLVNNSEVIEQFSEGLKEEAYLNMPPENQATFKKNFTMTASNNEEDKSIRLSEQMKNMILKDNQKAQILTPSIKKEVLTSSIKYEEEFNELKKLINQKQREYMNLGIKFS